MERLGGMRQDLRIYNGEDNDNPNRGIETNLEPRRRWEYILR